MTRTVDVEVSDETSQSVKDCPFLSIRPMESIYSSSPAPTILIVDDTPVNVLFLQNVLDGEGFRTITAADGASARELSRAEVPDLILLDVMMPGESGFETCSKLKSDPKTADIPVIFLSALDDVKSKVSGLKIGGVDYVSKPVHGEEVLARVRVHLRIRENNRAMARQHQARMEELRDAQQAILVRPEDCPDASFAVFYQPMEAAGGDFYDVLPLDSGVFGYFVADVSGHGVSAAFLTSAIKALLRQHTRSAIFAGRHHARNRRRDAPDAGRRTISDRLLREFEPADGQAFGGECRAPSRDRRERLRASANARDG